MVIILNNHVVGNVYNFSARSYGDGRHGCENCHRQQEENMEVTGQVPITHALRKHFLDENNDALTAFDQEAISKYLREKLEWKIVKVHSVLLFKTLSLYFNILHARLLVVRFP